MNFGSLPTARLQRLPQSLLQLRAVGSTDARPRTVFQDYFKLAMRDRLQLKDAFNVYNGRSMYANESHRVELIHQFVKRGAVQQFPSGNMKIYIYTSGFDPVDVYNADEARGSSGFHDQPVDATIRW